MKRALLLFGVLGIFAATLSWSQIGSEPLPPDELTMLIENAPPGSVIRLPDRKWELSRTVKVGSKVTITGGPNTLISLRSRSGAYAFDASNSEGVAIKNLAFSLRGNAGGILGTNTKHINVSGNLFSGDIYDHLGPRIAQFVAIFIDASADASVTGNLVTNTFGGIYATNSDRVRIGQNKLDHVNFGQIVASGHDFIVKGNEVFFSGIPNRTGSVSRQGDAFTSLGLSGLTMEDNLFFGSYCYQAAFTLGKSENITIKNNTMAYGITHAIQFPGPASDVDIENNTFVRNAGNAIAADSTATNFNVEGNRLIGDGMIFSGEYHGLTVEDNAGLTAVTDQFRLRDLVLGTKLYLKSGSSGAKIDLAHDIDRLPEVNSNTILRPVAQLSPEATLPLEKYLPSEGNIQVISGSPVDGGMDLLSRGKRQKSLISRRASDLRSDLAVRAGMNGDYDNFYVRVWGEEDPVGAWKRLTIKSATSAEEIYEANWPHSLVSDEVTGMKELIESKADFYGLPPNAQNLRLLAGAKQGYGNKLDNIIIGNDATNILDGCAGNDIIVAGGGSSNSLTGGSGLDTFVFEGDDGASRILDFNPSEDKIVFSNTDLSSFEDVLENAEEKDDGSLKISYGSDASVKLAKTSRLDLRPEVFSFDKVSNEAILELASYGQ